MLSCLFLVSLETFTGLGFELKRQTHTHTHSHEHMHTNKLSLYSFHSSSRFVLFLFGFFSSVPLYSIVLCRVFCCKVQFLIIADSFYTIFWLGYSYANSFDSIRFNICLLSKQSIKLLDSSPIVCFQLFASQPAIHLKHPAYTNKTRNLINRKKRSFTPTHIHSHRHQPPMHA